MSVRFEPPAPRPCSSCPYRRDVASGIWDRSEYLKLPNYDLPTTMQPAAVFQCHQHDGGNPTVKVCAGWAGCHDGHDLFSLRLAMLDGSMSPDIVEAVADYVSPVPLFDSGAEAAAHGLADAWKPGPRAIKEIEKIARVRTDLRTTTSPARTLGASSGDDQRAGPRYQD